MRAYKGFTKTDDGKLMCRNMEYEPGKTYRFEENDIKLCESGFHACHELHQVWYYYPNDGFNVFYEVECGGKIIESDDGDGKFVCSEITLVKEVDMDNVALFDGACSFSNCFATVRLNGKWNFISTEGRILSEQWFDDAWDFSDGLAMVEIDGKYNFINTEGKLLSEQWFDYAGCFSEGFARVKLDGKRNFINTEGKLLSEQWFDDAGYFSEGFARVKLDGKFNFINAEGKLLSNQWFDYASYFHEGFASVELGGNVKRINKKGEII